MKILKNTRKYYHVRINEEELNLLENAITEKKRKEEQKAKELKTAEWFFNNHVYICWEDEYGTNHDMWENIRTGNIAHPDYFTVLKYRYQFKDVIDAKQKEYNESKYKII
jgi:hypothetical protein